MRTVPDKPRCMLIHLLENSTSLSTFFETGGIPQTTIFKILPVLKDGLRVLYIPFKMLKNNNNFLIFELGPTTSILYHIPTPSDTQIKRAQIPSFGSFSS